jgi:anthranilate synthase/aminodeoxychorismate synthase-like glutamine amidotransferase
MLLLLDNYDSFTFNLYDYFVQNGAEVDVVRNDEIDVKSIEEKYKGIIISPGPGLPDNAGKTLEIIDRYHTTKPFFGVCLGMQAIAQYFGGKVIHANYPMHGKVSTITFEKDHPLFAHIKSPLDVCRYHSLIVSDINNSSLKAIAHSPNGEIMALAHQNLPIWGVQFHPEAILTSQGLKLIRNWLTCFTL